MSPATPGRARRRSDAPRRGERRSGRGSYGGGHVIVAGNDNDYSVTQTGAGQQFDIYVNFAGSFARCVLDDPTRCIVNPPAADTPITNPVTVPNGYVLLPGVLHAYHASARDLAGYSRRSGCSGGSRRGGSADSEGILPRDAGGLGPPAVSGMHIVIVGGGEIGLGLSRALAPRHDVIVIDHVAAIADRFAALDVQVIVGNGTNPDVLRQAGVATCDFLVAATGMDEVNVLAALIARRLGSPKTICLTSRDDLLQPFGGRDLLREHVGVDRVVWPEGELAENIGRIVAVPGALDAETFAQGRVALLEYRLDAGSRLLTAPLSSVHLPRGVLIVAVRRHDRVLIPDGATRLEAGDKVFVMGLASAVANVRTLFHHAKAPDPPARDDHRRRRRRPAAGAAARCQPRRRHLRHRAQSRARRDDCRAAAPAP